MPCSYESVRRHSRVVFSNPGPDINFTTQLVNPCLVLSQPTSLLNEGINDIPRSQIPRKLGLRRKQSCQVGRVPA
ncbi:hypothetical protein Bca52824_081332 [Brassica carinata]|uniref:Uncharacterized protein n=1 Tax=Brassica carinata TaxID=52824 RepID=A0A8X7TT57_BRACI|nr:hypothetical protein Bca52824_081332 [Brassica carinata]